MKLAPPISNHISGVEWYSFTAEAEAFGSSRTKAVSRIKKLGNILNTHTEDNHLLQQDLGFHTSRHRKSKKNTSVSTNNYG